MNLQQLIENKKNQLYFIELNKSLEFGEITIPKGLDLPVDSDAIREVAQDQSEGFNIKTILKDVSLVLGIDPEFIHAPVYRDLVVHLVENPFNYCMFLGIKASETKMWIDAIAYFKAALSFEEHIDAFFNLGKVYYALALEESGALKEALKLSSLYFEKAYKLEKKPEIAYYLTFVLHYQEHHQSALDFARIAISSELNEVLAQDLMSKIGVLEDKALYECGYQLILEERFQEGLESLLAISEEAQDDWRIQFFMGLAYRGLTLYESALKHLLKARDFNAGDDRIYNELGIVAMLMGDNNASKHFFMEGLNLKPLNSEILCNLAILYLELNELNLARKFIEEAYEIDPEDDIIINTKAAIEAYRYDS